MKEVRPSTWVLLGVLVLVIFGPLFLLDIEPIQRLEPANNAPNIRPSNPRATNSNKPAPPANEVHGDRLPANDQPDDGLLE